MISGSLTQGTTIGRYEVRHFVRAGGMGEVYLADDRSLDRPVALKILPHDRVIDSRHVQRFVNEAKAASALSHPSIVTVYDSGEETIVSHEGEARRVYYIAMEWIDGATLDEWVLHDHPIASVLEQFARIAEGLGQAHTRGIVHRDLKPANVMITSDGNAKVLDFGVAKLIDPDLRDGTPRDHRTLTEPRALVGTVGYMSPEQIEGFPVDHRADIFSFGSMLYECVTGRSPFRAETTAETLRNIVHVEPPPLETSDRHVSDAVRRIVNRCIAKEPDRRYDSAHDLALDLREAAALASSDSGKWAVATAFRTSRKSRARGLALLLLAVVLTIAPALGLVESLGAITGSSDEVKQLQKLVQAERKRSEDTAIELKAKEREISGLDAEIASLRAERDESDRLRSNLEDAYRKLAADLGSTIKTSTSERKALLGRVAEAETELRRFRDERIRQAAEINELKAIQHELSPLIEGAFDARGLVLTLPGVFFSTGDSSPERESHVILARVAEELVAHPDIRVTIEGHTDSKGSADENLRLSQFRADAVRDLLARAGVATERLTTIGRGEFSPRWSNGDSLGRIRNRRIEMVLSL